MTEWNSKQYLKFKNERTQPAIDLAMRICDSNASKIIDIGCGPGNSTAELKNVFPNSYIIGIDNSRNMIDTAQNNYPEIDFMCLDASREISGITDKFDIVFSNACIQWIPDHPTLLRNLMSLLSEGGKMAIQTPMNYNEPIHQIIEKLIQSVKWRSKFENPRIFYNLKPREYNNLLSEISSDFIMWETTYYHRMKSHESIMEWYKGTGLRPYLEVLNETDRDVFETDVFTEVARRYQIQSNNEVIFKFPRLFFVATK